MDTFSSLLLCSACCSCMHDAFKANIIVHAVLARVQCLTCNGLCTFLSLPAGEFQFDFEEQNLTEQNIRDYVWEEMCVYHP